MTIFISIFLNLSVFEYAPFQSYLIIKVTGRLKENISVTKKTPPPPQNGNKIIARPFPANIYLFKVNNRNTRKRCKICLKLTIKTEQSH